MRSRREFIRVGLATTAVSALGTKRALSGEQEDRFSKGIQVLAPLFEKKKEPLPSDWLANHPEKGQTFAQYLASRPNRPTAERTKLYLQPIGTFAGGREQSIPKLREFMRLFFGLDVDLLKGIGTEGIPAAAQRKSPQTGMTQLLSTHVLDKVLLPKRPRDAVAVLAITPVDLWPGEGWNFVFGQASLGERVGVWSTARFGDPEKIPARYLRRTLQVAIHETGHMFGIKHCTAYECCMNGSNNLAESDRAPLYFCPECDAKLWWACKLDPLRRAVDLAAFAEKNSLAREAAMWREVAKARF